MGDPIRALQAAKQIEVITKTDLVSHTARVGGQLYDDLADLAKGKGSGKMLNLRGKNDGTFIAFDMPSSAARDTFVNTMRGRGVNIAGVSCAEVWNGLVHRWLTTRGFAQCGEAAVRLRPMLIFGEDHKDVLMSHVEEVMGGR